MKRNDTNLEVLMNDIICALLDHGAMSSDRLASSLGRDLEEVRGVLFYMMHENIVDYCRAVELWTYSDAIDTACPDR